MQSSAPIAGRHDPIAAQELLHSGDHLDFVRTAVIETVGGGGFDLGEKGRRGIGNRDW